jgi:hypothetical protein
MEKYIDACFRCKTECDEYNDKLLCINKCTTCLSSCKICKKYETENKKKSKCVRCRRDIFGCSIIKCENCGDMCNDCSPIMYDTKCSECYCYENDRFFF